MKMILGSFFSPTMLKWAVAPLVFMSLSLSAFADTILVGDYRGRIDWDRGELTNNWVDPNNWDSSNITLVTDPNDHNKAHAVNDLILDPNDFILVPPPVTVAVANNILPLFNTNVRIGNTGGTPEQVDINSGNVAFADDLDLARAAGDNVTLDIKLGGSLTVSDKFRFAHVDPNTVAVVNVSGTLTVNDDLEFGRQGTATVELSGTASLIMTSDEIYIGGDHSENNQIRDPNGVEIGFFQGSGTLIMSGTASLVSADDIRVGHRRWSSGTLLVSGDATIVADGRIEAAKWSERRPDNDPNTPVRIGEVEFDPNNPVYRATIKLSDNANVTVHFLRLGRNGDASLEMSDNSKLTFTSFFSDEKEGFVAADSGSGNAGVSIIDNAIIDSQFPGAGIHIGNNGYASLFMRGNATLKANDGYIIVGNNDPTDVDIQGDGILISSYVDDPNDPRRITTVDGRDIEFGHDAFSTTTIIIGGTSVIENSDTAPPLDPNSPIFHPLTIGRRGTTTFGLSGSARISAQGDLRFQDGTGTLTATMTGGTMTAGDAFEIGGGAGGPQGTGSFAMSAGTITIGSDFDIKDDITFDYTGGTITFLSVGDPNDPSRLRLADDARLNIGNNADSGIAEGSLKLVFDEIARTGTDGDNIDFQLGGLIELTGDHGVDIADGIGDGDYIATGLDPNGVFVFDSNTTYLAPLGDSLHNEYGVKFDFDVTASGKTSIFVGEVPKLPGDFDLDGDVDGNDFFLWQTDDIVAGYLDNGSLSPVDLEFWAGHYGDTIVYALSAVTAAVPEPSSLMLIAVGLLGLGRRRRKQL